MAQPASRLKRVEDTDAAAMGAAALGAFFAIAEHWGLSNDQQQVLLGQPGRSTFFKWKRSCQGRLSLDTLERISYLLGIYKALQILLPGTKAADAWPKKPNTAPLFAGRSALDLMLQGRVLDLAEVRRYLDGERS